MVAYSSRHEHKRHGKHQKHTRNFLKVYTPYLPLVIIVIIGFILSSVSPPRINKRVLAYATSMSVSELLTATNQDRAASGLPALTINSQLTSAAQTKANDMVTRDYWSHNTPDGQPPWVFITNAGYSYQAAGENLAYGFSSGSATEAGWMNSPEHKANVLNSAYVEVGFGYANSANFVGSGQETVVVAEYAKPASSSAAKAATVTNTPSPPAASTSQPSQSTTPAATTPPANNPTTPSPVQTTKEDSNKTAAKTAIAEPASQSVTRLSKLTGPNLAWLATATSAIAVISLVALALRHTFAVSKWLRQGQRYVMHHFVFDITIISLVGLCLIANQSIGFIR